MIALIHPRRLLLFLLLSLSDLLLTWLLVERGGGAVYESNPVADWWLGSYGWAGLAAFKLLTVLVVVGLTVLVSRARPRSGGLILSVACSVLALVVGYSCYLVGGGARAADEPDPAQFARLRAEEASLDAEWQKSEEYRATLDQLSADLAAGRCSLTEATAQLGSTPKGQEPRWLRQLHVCFPEATDGECLAINLSLHTVMSARDDPAEAEHLARRLGQELTASFGASPRWDYRHLLTQAGLRHGDEQDEAPVSRPRHSARRRLG
jgi:hypothetical protein